MFFLVPLYYAHLTNRQLTRKVVLQSMDQVQRQTPECSLLSRKWSRTGGCGISCSFPYRQNLGILPRQDCIRLCHCKYSLYPVSKIMDIYQVAQQRTPQGGSKLRELGRSLHYRCLLRDISNEPQETGNLAGSKKSYSSSSAECDKEANMPTIQGLCRNSSTEYNQTVTPK